MLRPMGPPFSCPGELHIWPVRLMSPSVMAKPTRLYSVLGITIDPPVSLPRPTVPIQAAIDAPVPELEPPPDFLGLYGLTTGPAIVLPPGAATPYQSDWLSLARMIAPDLRKRSIIKASLDGCDVAIGLKPPEVGMSFVSKTSFARITTPCSGERGPFALRSASRARASASAFLFSVMTVLSFGPF